jgi:hypothetical protein
LARSGPHDRLMLGQLSSESNLPGPDNRQHHRVKTRLVRCVTACSMTHAMGRIAVSPLTGEHVFQHRVRPPASSALLYELFEGPGGKIA